MRPRHKKTREPVYQSMSGDITWAGVMFIVALFIVAPIMLWALGAYGG